jgi:1-acyl-sn-glycerol-3-phosphate acyltransferase
MSTTAAAAIDDPNDVVFYNACHHSTEEMHAMSSGSHSDRRKAFVPVDQVRTEHVVQIEPMSWLGEIACVLFLGFGVPSGALTVPIAALLVGKFVLNDIALAFKCLAVVLLPLALMPQPFVPSSLHSWMSNQVLKYFSFRFIMEGVPPTQSRSSSTDDTNVRPQILVAPPHGVFPYGNILSMLVWPALTGHHFMGLAANAALRAPLFKQVLRSIGVVDASRHTARACLETFPRTIGISTGGVAEVFNTNHDDECILLRERVGLIKLAIRTGADLVPCYLFGNTDILHCWAGEGIPGGHKFLEKISRKLGFALILFTGRFGLPIPHRVPVLGVKGRPIPTFKYKCEEPSDEVVKMIQDQLVDAMQKLFDTHKHLYGWQDKHLIIK